MTRPRNWLKYSGLWTGSGKGLAPAVVALAALMLAVAACSGGDRESSGGSDGPADRPTLQPLVGFGGQDRDGGYATATPWPTFTPVSGGVLPAVDVVVLQPTGTPEVAADDGSAEKPSPEAAIAPTATPPRFACRIDYRLWLIDNPDIDTPQELKDSLPDFRALRPDCGIGRFEPVFRLGPVCGDENRVGGITVAGQLSRGRDYNHNRRLGPTGRTGYGDILIHFERLPERTEGGCWYYHGNHGEWYEEVVGGLEPTATPAPDLNVRDYAECDAELQSRMAGLGEPADYQGLNELVLQVSTGLSACALGWYPVVSEFSQTPDCPDEASGRAGDGSVLAHWGEPPPDGSYCWIYDPAADSWEVR